MRHRKAGAKLGRTTSHRRAMMRNMVTSLFENEKVVTTLPKAKAVKPLAEKLITLAKRGDLHARRQVLSVLTKKSVTHKLFDEMAGRFMDRSGGYTSVIKIGPRKGDAAEMAVLELVKPEEVVKTKKKGRKKKAAKKTVAAPAAAPKGKAKAAPAEPAPAAEPEAAPAETAEAKPEPVTEASVETAAAPEEAQATDAPEAEGAPAEEAPEDKKE